MITVYEANNTFTAKRLTFLKMAYLKLFPSIARGSLVRDYNHRNPLRATGALKELNLGAL